MKLCIAEKPSVAREIATILGASSKRDGYFEGNGYWVSYTYGHLCTLKEPKDYHPAYGQWRLDLLPMLPKSFGIKVIGIDNYERQFGVLQKLLDDCTEVINCGDAGQEGELIQRWVLHHAKCTKPLKRLWISSLTAEAIKEGFENLEDGSKYDNLYAAGACRAMSDWLLGLNATRAYTLKYGIDRQVLSVGRVQTPTLAMIVARQKEIRDFVPQPYWEVKTTYREVVFNSTKGKYLKEEEAQAAAESIKTEDFEVTDFQKKAGKELPPNLFDLTSIQVEANKKFGFSADDTLKMVQSLYEKKFITYPRTDSVYLSNDIYPKVPGILKGLTAYSNFTTPLLGDKIRKSKKVFNDSKVSDHHAIIPTGEMPQGINYNEKLIFDAISRRFIAVFYPDCKVSNTTVMGKVAAVDFKATGRQIVDPGWRVLYPQKKKTEKPAEGETEKTKKKSNEPQELPAFEKGERGPHEPDLQQKETSPPKYYSEATLLQAMETAGKQVDDQDLRDLMKENGIGRPSTRANIIETLFKRTYIVRVRKHLEATPTGEGLIDTIKNDLLKSVELTGSWEKKLRDIELGNYESKTFLEEMRAMVTGVINEVKMSERTVTIAPTVAAAEKNKDKIKSKSPAKAKADTKVEGLTCPKCQEGELKKGKTAYGCSLYGKSCKFLVPFSIRGKKLTEKQVHQLVTKKKTGTISGFVDGENKIKGKLVLQEDGNVGFEGA